MGRSTGRDHILDIYDLWYRLPGKCGVQGGQTYMKGCQTKRMTVNPLSREWNKITTGYKSNS